MAPTHKKKKKSSKQSSIKRLETWLESFDTVSAAVQKHDLVQLLEAGGGITKIKDFLPAFVAEGILETLEQCSDAHWNVSCCCCFCPEMADSPSARPASLSTLSPCCCLLPF